GNKRVYGAKADTWRLQDEVLPVEPIVRPDDGPEISQPDPPPARPVKNRERIVGPEQEPCMHLWMALQPPQHSEAVRQGQRRDVCEEIRVALHQVQERAMVWLIRDQAVAASMGGDDWYTLIQGTGHLAGITG